MKKTFKAIVSLFFVFLMMTFCMVVSTSAATSSGTIYNEKQTITVITKANYAYPGSSSVTLSQNKGTISYSKTNLRGKVTGTAKTKEYGTWKVVAKSTDGKSTVSKKLTGSSVTLNLKPNKTYKITVTYDTMSEILLMYKRRNSTWTITPSWKVKSTNKVSSCY
jgi:hypothetical protein